MEFFATLKTPALDKDHLKILLTIKNLPKLCKSINSILSDEKKTGVIYCIWGEFQINREELKYGIRFSMPNCPNAFAWSITTDDGENTVIHCTINKLTHNEDFIESI
ncbi:MAG: hypothetical protein QM487_07415 [Candidatus Marithrix sp.]